YPAHRAPPSFPTRRSSDLGLAGRSRLPPRSRAHLADPRAAAERPDLDLSLQPEPAESRDDPPRSEASNEHPSSVLDRRHRREHRSEEHTSELQSLAYLVCR